MELKNGICNIGGTDFQLKYTLGVALEMEKLFGGLLLSLTAVESVKGACDVFGIMLKHAIIRHNEEWNENVSLNKYAIDEILFDYLEDTESALNIIREVKEVIKRDRKTEESRIKSKKKNGSNKYIRNDLQTMVVTGTSLLNFSYSDVLKLTIAEYSGYLNRYNEINYYDPTGNDDAEDEEPDESYNGVGNLAELLDKQVDV